MRIWTYKNADEKVHTFSRRSKNGRKRTKNGYCVNKFSLSIFWLVLRCLLVARKENSTSFSTGLTGRSKNLDPTGNPTGWSTRPAGRPYRFPSLVLVHGKHRNVYNKYLSYGIISYQDFISPIPL